LISSLFAFLPPKKHNPAIFKKKWGDFKGGKKGRIQTQKIYEEQAIINAQKILWAKLFLWVPWWEGKGTMLANLGLTDP
jgi:hypothetical protein